MAFDIFNPTVSKIAQGIEGKAILVYGGNKCGKTYQLAHMPKPFVFAYELGLEAIDGIPFFYPQSWYAGMSVLDQFLRNPAKARETYQTIVFDQLEAVEASVVQHVCDKAGVKSLSEKPKLPNGKIDGWWNGYTQVTKEINAWVSKLRVLIDSGFTLCFIAHEGTRKYSDPKKGDWEKQYPRGGKHIIDPITDMASFICYAQSNGVDTENNVIPSSLYMYDTPERLGGGRFKTAVPMLPVFSAEALVEAISNATVAQAAAFGTTAVTNEEIVAERTAPVYSFDEIKGMIAELAKKVYDFDRTRYLEVTAITERILGAGKSVSKDTTPEDTERLNQIYWEIKEFVETDPALKSLVA